jgi:hypothetical protein
MKAKFILTLLGLAILSALTVAPSAGAAPAAQSSSTKLCVDVQDINGVWLANAICDGRLITPAGGIHGLGIEVKGNNNLNVHYNAYAGGKWLGEEKNGAKLGNGTDPFKAVRILLSPRNGKSVKYTVVDMGFNQYDKRNGETAGNMTDTLRSISVKYRN